MDRLLRNYTVSFRANWWKIAATLLFFTVFPLAAQNNFSRGEDLFMQNQPAEALPFLTAAAEEDPANVKAYLYLAVAYLQLDRGDDAIATYLRVLSRGGGESSQIAYNLGNIYYARDNNEMAVKYYTEAITADPANASAYLNRANALVRSGLKKEALSDYGYYLTLEPRSAKRAQIEQLTAFINEEFAAAERQRILEEQRRLEAEAQAKAEAERKQRLLEEVSASLQAAAEETQGLSAGSEGMLDYESEFELAE
ncbi:MAG: tetratricopeptide repeat protein [Treponema sp.]|nr:tetratricopeptide repeat protein [Treponema sp.]